MISLPLKQTEAIDIITQPLQIVERESGPHIAAKVRPVLQRAQNLRDKLLKLPELVKNQALLSETANAIKEYISMWHLISQNLVFGKGEDHIDIVFVWKDAYTKEKRKSYNPISERIAMLYNLAAVYNQLGIYMASAGEDRPKEAFNAFLTAAWIAEQIRGEKVGLRPEDCSLDLEEASVNMYSMLMRGQAQGLVCEIVSAGRPEKHSLHTKLAMQAAIYYKNVHDYGMSGPLKKISTIVNIVKFNELFFTAKAFYHSAVDLNRQHDSNVVGASVADIQYAYKCLEAIKKIVPPDASNPYNEFVKECADKLRFIENQNTKLYKVPVANTHSTIEGLAYDRPISIEAELNRPVEGREWLARMISPEVRKVKEEYETEVGKVRAETRERMVKTDEAMSGYKNKCREVLNGAISEELLWNKVEKCRDKGDVEELTQKLRKLIVDINFFNDKLLSLQERLRKEEQEDQTLRTKYDALWQIPPSTQYNDSCLKQIEQHLLDLANAKKLIVDLIERLNEQKESFKILDLNKEEFMAAMPETNTIALPTAALEYFTRSPNHRLNELIKELEELREKGVEEYNKMVRQFASENVVAEVSQMHQEGKDNEKVSLQVKSRLLIVCRQSM
eukprot:TRINITY_DN4987_c0_g1_i2.p1 TRINITY_DN4987_c0_g1~~TRINITY_DN4987_c0_g1_i2.p1  ORF type:complete len:619 (-),score=160.01 TRINITY_DN4987_c0_g1_i2:91-1947(-)